jgi:2-oxoisovalerate dehydrogenase E1 component
MKVDLVLLRELMIEIFERAIEIRASENKLLEAYKERLFGGTVHTCVGQEIIPVAISSVVSQKVNVISNHRGHGHYIAHTDDKSGLFSEFLGKKGSPASGIGGSQHLFGSNYLSNGIQGCTAPFAVGIGCVEPTIIYLGDGTFGEGTLYEALNLSQLVKSNILFVIEKNNISQSSLTEQVNFGSIIQKFESFEITTKYFDSAKPLEFFEGLKDYQKYWFKNKPCALVVESYRLNSHSKGDDTRSDDIIFALPDPLQIMAEQLKINYKEYYVKQQNLVNKTWEEVINLENIDFRTLSVLDVDSYKESLLNSNLVSPVRVNNEINVAIDNSLVNGALFIGEDINTKWNVDDKEYGGAFGVSGGLSEKFENVISTSISEAGLVGVAAGFAFKSKKLAIAEVMFADFSSLIVDQLYNGVDKYHSMFGCEVNIPLLVRTPYGMGKGYGPTHSQSPFELFSSLTSVTVLSYTPLLSYNRILERIGSSGKSAIIFEPKMYYGDRLEVWGKLIHNFTITEHRRLIASDFLLSNSNNPKLTVITHGSALKSVLSYICDSELEADVYVVSELYKHRDITSKIKMDIPICIIEEKNSDYGALITTISNEIILKNFNQRIHTNKPVKCIPANQNWESNLMISEKVVKELIDEVLK